MDVLSAIGGSWLGLDGSMSARAQLAVGNSGLSRVVLLDDIPDALKRCMNRL